MVPVAALLVLQTATPDPPAGPEELLEYGPAVVRAGWFVAGFLVVFLLGWYVVVPTISRTIRRRNRNNPTIHEALTRYLRLAVAVVAVFVGAGLAGYGGIVTDSAIVIAALTLAIGVAGQTVIGSLISGLVLVSDPEFNVGDYIEWSDGEGTVQSITLRVTRVETPDGELVTVPNTVLTGQSITRPYGRGRYRVVEHVGIAYEDDVSVAMRHFEAAADALEEVLADPPPEVYVDEFGEDAIVVRVHYWVGDPRPQTIHDVRSRYARAVKDRLDEAGVTISPASKRDLEGRIEVDESA